MYIKQVNILGDFLQSDTKAPRLGDMIAEGLAKVKQEKLGPGFCPSLDKQTYPAGKKF